MLDLRRQLSLIFGFAACHYYFRHFHFHDFRLFHFRLFHFSFIFFSLFRIFIAASGWLSPDFFFADFIYHWRFR